MQTEEHAHQVVVVFEAVTCPHCSGVFGVEKSQLASRRADGRHFYCPSGHSMSYTETTEQKLKRQHRAELASLVSKLDQREAYARDKAQEATRFKRKLAAQKGANTRLKNRISSGVCPCCDRTFSNLQAHMQAQHPDFTSTDD